MTSILILLQTGRIEAHCSETANRYWEERRFFHQSRTPSSSSG
jgi:hypothetical protein